MLVPVVKEIRLAPLRLSTAVEPVTTMSSASTLAAPETVQIPEVTLKSAATPDWVIPPMTAPSAPVAPARVNVLSKACVIAPA